MNATLLALDLEAVRQAIDGVDDALAGLLVCRASLSKRAQAMKTEAGVQVRDLAREAEIGRRYERAARGSSAVAAVILAWCRREN